MNKKKPKIAVLVPRYGIVERGVEVFTKDLVDYLGNEYDFEVFSRRNTFVIPESSKFIQWTKKFDKYFLNPIGIEMLSFSLAVFPKLLFGDFDLIFPQNGIWGALICRIVRAVKGTPFIYRSAGGIEPPIIRQNPNIYIATTPTILNWIRKSYKKQKATLIPNGVRLRVFSKNERINLRLKHPIYLCVGEFIESKRIELAIKAVAQLKNGSLLLLGNGKLKYKLRRLGENTLGKKRFMITKVPHTQIHRYYSSADVFTLPSVNEPFGIVYIEALASGLPVVAPKDETRKFILGRAGILCDVTDSKKYVDALRLAAKRKYGETSKKQSQKFNWETIGRKYSNCIDIIIGGRSSSLGN